MSAIETLATLFTERGVNEYLGEAVTQASHMLQAGALASQAGADEALVAAALLHDVGHLMGPTLEATDARHETIGADWLVNLGFPPEVTEPVRLHVAAKRYLCAVEPIYFDGLSPASRRSLELQGGPMRDAEAKDFAALEYAEAAVAVRRWDEAAKDPSAPTPAFDDFRVVLEQVLR